MFYYEKKNNLFLLRANIQFFRNIKNINFFLFIKSIKIEYFINVIILMKN